MWYRISMALLHHGLVPLENTRINSGNRKIGYEASDIAFAFSRTLSRLVVRTEAHETGQTVDIGQG